MRRILGGAAVAAVVTLIAFLHLATTPRWTIYHIGSREILGRQGTFFEWLDHKPAIPAEDQYGWDLHLGTERANRRTTWAAAATALAFGAWSVPVYVAVMWYVSWIEPIARSR